MKKGIFITAEGGEGAGKTTVLSKLKEELEERKLKVMLTREPGGIEIAEKIRSVILDKKHIAMDGRTEALLYAAARRQHLVEKILPALAEGYVVLCDRFLDSSIAYQGYARGIGIEEILSINQFAIEGHLPDLTLYFDIDPKKGLARIAANKDREVNRLDKEKITFHQQVRLGYLEARKRYPERIVLINADQSFDCVLQDTLLVVKDRLAKENE